MDDQGQADRNSTGRGHTADDQAQANGARHRKQRARFRSSVAA
jgi:hypothetical protein